VTTSRLFLTGITASGRHGANPGEKDRPQDFVVDLDVEVDVTSDDIAATADYRKLVQAARDVVAGESLDLLESDRLPRLDPRVVRLLDRREPSVRDDGAPPPRLGALEEVVLSPPETQERFEAGHAAIFAAAARRAVVERARAPKGLR